MRIHTRLGRAVLLEAGRRAGVGFHRLERHGSRTHHHAFNVVLSGTGREGGHFGTVDGHAATWDEWGIFLAALYRRDPTARCAGAGSYESAEHFLWSTNGRYETLTVAEQHRRHTWRYSTDESPPSTYIVHECTCGAVRRWLSGRTRFADVITGAAPAPVRRTGTELRAYMAETAPPPQGLDQTSNVMPRLPAAGLWVPRRGRERVQA